MCCSFSEKIKFNEDDTIFIVDGKHSIQSLYRYSGHTVAPQCDYLPSPNRSDMGTYNMDKCGYEDCPNCFVVYCNEDGRVKLSEKTCADYMNTLENGTFTP